MGLQVLQQAQSVKGRSLVAFGVSGRAPRTANNLLWRALELALDSIDARYYLRYLSQVSNLTPHSCRQSAV